MRYTDDDYKYYELVVREVNEKRALQNYMDLTQKAFSACVNVFTHQELMAKEIACIEAATTKSLSVNLRVANRFTEAQAQSVKNALDLSKKYNDTFTSLPDSMKR